MFVALQTDDLTFLLIYIAGMSQTQAHHKPGFVSLKKGSPTNTPTQSSTALTAHCTTDALNPPMPWQPPSSSSSCAATRHAA